MMTPAKCGRGWAVRCAHSRGATCRCQCGGVNHGTAAGGSAASRGPRHANYRIVRSDAHRLVLRDVGPWNQHLTITNDAEFVVGEFAESLTCGGPDGQPRRLFYYDSEGEFSELTHAAGRFTGFAPARESELYDELVSEPVAQAEGRSA